MATRNDPENRADSAPETRKKVSYRDDFGDDRRFRKLILTTALILLLVCGIFALTLTPFFTVKQITVRGLSHYPENTIIEETGIRTGLNAFEYLGSAKNILSLRNHQAESRLLDKYPWFKSAEVRFVPPASYEIRLTERTPYMQTEYGGGFIVFDKTGVAVDAIRKADDSLPAIKGFKEPGKPGSKLNGEDLLRLDDVTRFMSAVEWSNSHDKPDITGSVSQIDVGEVSGLRFVYDGRINVILGSSDQFDYRLAMFKRIISTNIQKSEKGTLDFVSGASPVFRPQ